MKTTFEIDLTCKIINETGWYGYEFTPGFFYKNKFYNSTWFHKAQHELNEFESLVLSHDVRDAFGDLVSNDEVKKLCVGNMEDCEIKKIILDLMKQAYAEYIL